MPMNECANASIRDLLPLHLNGRLPAAERDVVASHLEDCAACREEVELLRATRKALHRGPAVDAARIARAVPPYQANTPGGDPGVIRLSSRRRASPLWRIAAAAALVVGGGAALAIHQASSSSPQAVIAAGESGEPRTDSVEQAQNQAASASPQGRSSEMSQSPEVTPQLTFGGGLDGLSDEDLVALIAAFDDEDMIPSAEPGAVFGVPALPAEEEDS